MQQNNKSRFFEMISALAVFLLMALVLLTERAGVQIGNLDHNNPFLDARAVIRTEEALAPIPKTALVITDLGRSDSADAYAEIRQVLTDMKVSFDTLDLGSEPMPTSFSRYVTAVVVTPDMAAIGEGILDLMDWVSEGGRVLFTMTMEFSTYSDYVLQKSGVMYFDDYVLVDSIYFDEDFMLGGGQSYVLAEGFDSSLTVQLREGTEVFARSGGPSGFPLLWRTHCGKGTIVIANYGFYTKIVRGFYSSAYTLLEDVSAYPVLNAGIIFLDDMPSPVPLGDSQYIRRDYQTSIAAYYVNTWFPDIQHLSERYDFPLVGLVVENYEDATDGPIIPQNDTSRFSYFGNIILRSGGELGYHGFNHQPLCLENTDYMGKLDYKTWDSTAMDQGFRELMRFCGALFPQASFSTYVPPSNILSQEGREYLGSLYPAVRTISGSYVDEDDDSLSYVQEFGVAEDGIVELPRVTFGSLIDPSTLLIGVSELNFHMAFSHFIHPDDAMDPDRGADLGWEKLYSNLDGFLQWVTEADPSLRRLDAAHFSGTIQRWAMLTVEKQWKNEKTLSLHLGNFVDEAYLQLRFNTGTPAAVNGGTLTKLTDTLYLLEARQADITLEWS